MAKSDKPKKKHVPKKRQDDSNNCWDELKALHARCAELLATPAPIAAALRDRKAIANCNDKDALKQDAKILMADINEYRDRLKDIQEKHNGLTGGTENPDELMASFSIGEGYQHWINSFQQVVIPTVQRLSDNLLGKDKPAEEDGAKDE